MIRNTIRTGDPWLLLPTVLLASVGALMVYSASMPTNPTSDIDDAVFRHLTVAAGSVGIILMLSRIDYRSLRHLSTPIYATSILLLIAVMAVGVTEFGAQRWLAVGNITLQPSELAKPALALTLAAYMCKREPSSTSVLVTLGILTAPAVLILMQPDTGTVLVLVGLWFGAVVAWGAPWRILGVLLATLLSLTPLLFTIAIPGYQRERLAVFLDPQRDPLGSGFNLRQAEAALRSGGLTGRGLFENTKSTLDGVGARASDFMFAHLGEQLGLLGGLLLLLLFGLIIWRGIRAALMAPDTFGRLLAAGVTMLLFTQAFMHTAVNLRLFPATGLPLPFVSQGGSSLLAMSIAAGLLLSVASRHRPDPHEQWSAQRWR